AVFVHGGDDRSGPYFDTELCQRRARGVTQRVRKRREQIRTAFEKDDARGFGMDVAEIVTQRLSRDLGKRTRELDAGGSAADDDEREQPALRDRIALPFRGLERQQHPPSHLERIVQRLETRCARLPLRVAEVRVRRAGGDDQIVVGERSMIGDDRLRRRIDRADIGQQHLDVPLVAQDPADRRRDVSRGQRRRRHLIEQRLKDMVVVSIEQRDLDRSIRQSSRRVEPAKPAAYDDDARFTVHGSWSQCYRTVVRTKPEPILGGPATVVDTACPLDCPDACSLAVTVQRGKVVTIDGSTVNPVTNGFICAKVRKFDQVAYGPDRLLYPAVRNGRKGDGKFKRVSWDVALELVAKQMREAKAKAGGASILPYSYGGSNGLMTQDNFDAQIWRRFGTSRLARTVCAAPTGAANAALY